MIVNTVSIRKIQLQNPFNDNERKVNSMKKSVIYTLILSAIFLLSLTACNQKNAEKQPVTNTQNSAPATQQTPPVTGEGDVGDEGGMGEVVIPKMSDEINDALVKDMTPNGATVITNTAGTVIMSSELSLEELTSYYKDRLEGMDAVQTSADDSREGFWTYEGSYDEIKTITIELRDDKDSRNIIVTY